MVLRIILSSYLALTYWNQNQTNFLLTHWIGYSSTTGYHHQFRVYLIQWSHFHSLKLTHAKETFIQQNHLIPDLFILVGSHSFIDFKSYSNIHWQWNLIALHRIAILLKRFNWIEEILFIKLLVGHIVLCFDKLSTIRSIVEWQLRNIQWIPHKRHYDKEYWNWKKQFLLWNLWSCYKSWR